MAERWTEVKGSAGYELTKSGKFRSWNNTWGQRSLFPHDMNPTTGAGGVLQYKYTNNSGKRMQTTCRALMLETFVGPRPKNFVAGCTKKNAPHSELRIKYLKWIHRGKLDVESYGKGHLNKTMVLEILHHLKQDVILGLIAKKYKTTYQTIWRIKVGLSWARVTGIKYERTWLPFNSVNG